MATTFAGIEPGPVRPSGPGIRKMSSDARIVPVAPANKNWPLRRKDICFSPFAEYCRFSILAGESHTRRGEGGVEGRGGPLWSPAPPQRVEFKTGHHCRNEVRDQCTHPVREYALSIPDHCPEGRESSVPSWRGHIVPEKGDKDQDTPPLTPSVLAGILGMDAVLHRGSPSFRVNCRARFIAAIADLSARSCKSHQRMSYCIVRN